MYNHSYINDFNIVEYEKYLKSQKLLDTLKNEYLKKYGEGSDAVYMAFKESLDHYVAKKIDENKDYINSVEFKNYFEYIEKVSKQNYIKNGKNKIFIELNTNVVFDYLNENDLQKIKGWENNSIKSTIKNNEIGINKIIDKIKANEIISDTYIKLLSKYFDNKKDFSNPEFKQNYEYFIKYIMNNRQNLKTSPELLSSVLAFLPTYYREGIENTRTYLTEFDSTGKDRIIKWAHSSGMHKYTAFQIKQFENLDLSSTKSLGSSRTYREKDLMFLIFVQFHELTHQVQKNRTKKNNFDINAIPYEINQLFRKEYNDYEVNHDSDEIEIEADEQAWKKIRWFIFENLPESDERRNDVKKCVQNAKAVNCRRAFSIKKDLTTGKRLRAINYDMDRLIDAVKENTNILDNFFHLKSIINENGKIKTDILFDEKITISPAGRTISNYILNNASEKLFIDKINSGNYSDSQIINMIENFVEVPHANALYLRELKNIDLKTYKETISQCNIEENLENVFNTYFVECSEQLLKFSAILESVRSRFDDKYVNSCYKFYIQNYYSEMLKNINCPRKDEIKNIMKKFNNSGNKILQNTARITIDFINKKDDIQINPDKINKLSNDDLKTNTTQFCDSLNTMYQIDKKTNDKTIQEQDERY